MHRGYVKLWRKITDWTWYRNANTLATFVHLIIKCNHKDSSYLGHPVPRGSCVIGRKQMSKDIGISERSLRTCITRLKSTNDLTIKATNRFSIASIVNYEQYQENMTSQLTNESTFHRPTNDQQTTTSKECKNEKNEKNTMVEENQSMKGLAPKVVKVTKETTTYEPVKTLEDCAPPPAEWIALKNRVRVGAL